MPHDQQLLMMLEQFLAYLRIERGLSQNTVYSYGHDLRQFIAFLAPMGMDEIKDIKREHISHFCQMRSENLLSAKTLHRNLSALRRFFWFLRKEGRVTVDPTLDIDLPKVEKRLPRYAKVDEIDELIKKVSQSSVLGVRDVAIIAILYATGLRVSELIALKLFDIDFLAGFIRTTGKGKIERVVPLNEPTMALVAQYLETSRVKLLLGHESDLVFIRRKGIGLSRQGVWKIIKKYGRLSGMKGDFSPHQLRHSFATHMLEGGINLRALQLMLGHRELATTQIYMHVDRGRLLALYDKYHPRSKIKYDDGL